MARKSLGDTTNNFTATGDPTVNDDISLGYDIGSRWVNVSADTAWVCVDNADGSAVWTEITAGAAGGIGNVVEDVTPQLGGNLDMNGFNIQTVTPTEMAYVSGVTSAIQTQLNGKAASSHTHVEADITDLGSYLVTTNNLSDLNNAGTARTNLGVAIGTDVQAYDATLASIAALGTAADRLAYTTGIDTWAETAITSFGRSLIDDADASAARTTLGLVIGTNVQAYDAELAALAGLTSAANKLPYFTGSGTADVTDLTAFARTILDDADAGTVRTTIGAGTLSNLSEDTTPQLGGDLDTNGNDITLAENDSIVLDGAVSATDKWTGIKFSGTAGTTVNFGDAVYLAVADTRWELVDASAVGTAGTVPVFLTLGASTDGNSVDLLVQGIVRDTAWTWTVGGPIYLSETGTTGNTLTQTAPTTADAVVKVVGYALTADTIYWNPSVDHITVTG